MAKIYSDDGRRKDVKLSEKEFKRMKPSAKMLEKVKAKNEILRKARLEAFESRIRNDLRDRMEKEEKIFYAKLIRDVVLPWIE